MSDIVSETALINLNALSNLYSLDQYQRLVIINRIYHVKGSARNSLDKLERTQQFIFTGSISKACHNKLHFLMPKAVSETALISSNVLSNLYSLDQYQRLVIINCIYHAKGSFRNSLDKLKRTQQFIFTGSISKACHNKHHLSSQIQYQKPP